MLTEKKILAISQVMLLNRDLMDLAESRGVSFEDLRKIFNLAGQAAAKLCEKCEELRENSEKGEVWECEAGVTHSEPFCETCRKSCDCLPS